MLTKTVIVVALVMALFAPTASSGGWPTYVSHNCTGARTEPGQIMFACADGGFYVNHLEWKFWHRDRARANGIYHMNDCKPSCAGGTFHERTGHIVLRRPEMCPDIDKKVFRRATVVYDKPWRGETRERLKLFCPYS